MGLASKVFSDITVSFLMKISLKARGLIIIPLLTILVGVSEYGAYVQVMALATLTANICSLRLDSGYVRYIQKTDFPRRLYTSLVILMTVVGLLGGMVFSFAATPLATYTLQNSQFSTLFLLGGVLVPLKCIFQIGRGYFKANRRIKIYSTLEAVDVYFSIIAMISAVIVLNTGVVGAFASYLVARCVMLFLIYSIILNESGIAWPTRDSLAECIRFSVGSMGHLVSQSLLDKVDRVLLGVFLGASAVGIYSVAYSVAYLMLLYFRPLSISFFPEFSRLWDEDELETIRNYTTTGVRFVTLLGIPSIAGFWLIGDAVLELLSTETVSSEGVVPLVLLAAGMLAKGIGEIYAQLFFAANNSRTPAIVQGGAVMINILLNILLIPFFGIIGASFATVLSFVVSAGVLLVLFREYLRVYLPWIEITRITIATAAMTVLVLSFTWSWILTLAIAPFVYFTVLYLLGGIRTYEIEFVVDNIRSVVFR